MGSIQGTLVIPISCLALDKSTSFSEPWFSYLYKDRAFARITWESVCVCVWKYFMQVGAESKIAALTIEGKPRAAV